MAPLLILLLPVSLLPLAAADAFPASCSNATCGNQPIHYPFWLDSSASDVDCGYPELGLVCEDNTTLILPVKAHRYRVSSISYETHTISVFDADADVDEYAGGCPRLHVNLSIDYTSSSLQLTPSDSNITFLYNCKKNASLSSAAAVELRGCQGDGGKSSYVLPDGETTGSEANEYECEEVVVAPVLDAHKQGMFGAPGVPPLANGSFGIGHLVGAGFQLMYIAHSQRCHGCERSGGWCGYRHNPTNGMTFTCFCDGGPTADRCGNHKGRMCKDPIP